MEEELLAQWTEAAIISTPAKMISYLQVKLKCKEMVNRRGYRLDTHDGLPRKDWLHGFLKKYETTFKKSRDQNIQRYAHH